MKKPKFRVGDKVVIRAGQLVIIDAEITKIKQIFEGVLIDYELKTNDIIFGISTPCFEEQFLFTKEEALLNFNQWINLETLLIKPTSNNNLYG